MAATSSRDVLLDRRARERGIFEPAAVERLLTRAPRGIDSQDADAIWGLLNLELWYRTFIDGDGIQTLPAPARRRVGAELAASRALVEPCESSGSTRTFSCRSTRAASCARGT